jgi:hypothetical protein
VATARISIINTTTRPLADVAGTIHSRAVTQTLQHSGCLPIRISYVENRENDDYATERLCCFVIFSSGSRSHKNVFFGSGSSVGSFLSLSFHLIGTIPRLCKLPRTLHSPIAAEGFYLLWMTIPLTPSRVGYRTGWISTGACPSLECRHLLAQVSSQ